MNEPNAHAGQAWYRNPMVWLVILLPTTAVVASIITIFIAVNTEDSLVVDEYYKKGIEINQDISSDLLADQLGLSAFVDMNTQSGEIQLTVKASAALQMSPELQFRLIHRTRTGLDQTTVLSRIGDSQDYRGYLKPPVVEGRWTIEVSSDHGWRLRQNLTTKAATHVLMNITS